jgi:hypothetical protein
VHAIPNQHSTLASVNRPENNNIILLDLKCSPLACRCANRQARHGHFIVELEITRFTIVFKNARQTVWADIINNESNSAFSRRISFNPRSSKLPLDAVSEVEPIFGVADGVGVGSVSVFQWTQPFWLLYRCESNPQFVLCCQALLRSFIDSLVGRRFSD